MSIAAVSWAYKQVISRSSAKFVLVTMANLVRHDDEDWQVFAAVDYLAKATELNRKTVIEALKHLRDAGFLVDTGRTTGNNRCIPVYRLAQPHQTTAPKPETPAQETAKPAPSNAGSPGKRLSSAWSLPPEWRVWARQQRGWDDCRIDAVAAIFHAHWTSSDRPEAIKPDWYSAWRLWVLKERDYLPQESNEKPAPKSSTPTHDYASVGAQIRAAMADMAAGKPGHNTSTDPNIIDVEMFFEGDEKTGYAQKRDNPIFPKAGPENGTGTGTEIGT